MNQVYVCGTYFHVYVSILKIIYTKNKDSKSLLILNDHTPQLETIIPLLKANGFFDYYAHIPFRKIEDDLRKNRSILSHFGQRNSNAIDAVEKNSEILMYDEFIQHSEINLFYNWGLPSAYFILKYKDNYFRILEDGVRNYTLRTSSFKLFKRKHILNTFIGDGFDDSVKEVQVQYPDKLDSRIRHKGTTLELKNMQDSLTPENNERILNVFMKGHTINMSTHKKFILITQPISEDKFVTERYKIKIYGEVVEKYSAGYEIFIKSHPREKTDYKKEFKFEFVEIPKSFPLEMLDLMGNIKFDVGVTLFSSALQNLACIREKIFLGNHAIKELLPGQKWLNKK